MKEFYTRLGVGIALSVAGIFGGNAIEDSRNEAWRNYRDNAKALINRNPKIIENIEINGVPQEKFYGVEPKQSSGLNSGLTVSGLGVAAGLGALIVPISFRRRRE